MTREQTEAFRTVEAALRSVLGDFGARPLPARIPPAPLGDEIRAQLSHRTAAQLAARIERRWVERGWSAKAAGEGAEGITSAVAVALDLVRAPECTDAGCEDGTYVDGGDCRTCEAGGQDRRRTRRSAAGKVPHPREGGSGPQAGAQRPSCVDCGQIFPSTVDVPADGVCGPCARDVARDAAEAERVAAEAAARWSADMATGGAQ